MCGVLFAYLGKNSFVFNRVNKQKTDKVGRILILDITLDADQYVQINIYNGNTETEEVKIFDELQSLKKCRYHSKKFIIFAGDFNIFFKSKLEGKGCKPLLKRKSLAKLLEIKERLDICDMWKIRSHSTRNFTFRQNHSTGFIERRLD